MNSDISEQVFLLKVLTANKHQNKTKQNKEVILPLLKKNFKFLIKERTIKYRKGLNHVYEVFI